MDSPDWDTLLKGVEELGHGAVTFYDTNLDDYVNVKIVEIDGDEVRVVLE